VRGKEGKEEAVTGGEEGSRARGGRTSGTRELALCVCVCVCACVVVVRGGGEEGTCPKRVRTLESGGKSFSIVLAATPRRKRGVRKSNSELVDIRHLPVFDHLTTTP
jgi:hypothetical protein